jgi:hypothetical protein
MMAFQHRPAENKISRGDGSIVVNQLLSAALQPLHGQIEWRL